MFGPAEVVFFKRLAVSGVVGDSGQPVDVVGYSIASGGTAGAITLKNGTATVNTAAWTDTATVVSQENTKSIGYPVRLNLGLYVSFDSNVTACTVFYRQVLTA